MKCRQISEHLSALMDGEITGSLASDVKAHLAECSMCRQALGELNHLREEVCRLPKPIPEPGLARRIQTAIQQEENNVAPDPMASGGLFRLLGPWRLAAGLAALAFGVWVTLNHTPQPQGELFSSSRGFLDEAAPNGGAEVSDLPSNQNPTAKATPREFARAPSEVNSERAPSEDLSPKDDQLAAGLASVPPAASSPAGAEMSDVSSTTFAGADPLRDSLRLENLKTTQAHSAIRSVLDGVAASGLSGESLSLPQVFQFGSFAEVRVLHIQEAQPDVLTRKLQDLALLEVQSRPLIVDAGGTSVDYGQLLSFSVDLDRAESVTQSVTKTDGLTWTTIDSAPYRQSLELISRASRGQEERKVEEEPGPAPTPRTNGGTTGGGGSTARRNEQPPGRPHTSPDSAPRPEAAKSTNSDSRANESRSPGAARSKDELTSPIPSGERNGGGRENLTDGENRDVRRSASSRPISKSTDGASPSQGDQKNGASQWQASRVLFLFLIPRSLPVPPENKK